MAQSGNPDAKRLYDDLLSNYNKVQHSFYNLIEKLNLFLWAAGAAGGQHNGDRHRPPQAQALSAYRSGEFFASPVGQTDSSDLDHDISKDRGYWLTAETKVFIRNSRINSVVVCIRTSQKSQSFSRALHELGRNLSPVSTVNGRKTCNTERLFSVEIWWWQFIYIRMQHHQALPPNQYRQTFWQTEMNFYCELLSTAN